MIFPNEKKKELWRYASRNNPATCDADGHPMPTQQLQPPPPPPQRLLHTCSSCSCCCTDQSSEMRPVHSPPPPYSSIPCSIDCSGSYRRIDCSQQTVRDQQHYQQQQQLMDMSVSGSPTEESSYTYIKDGCSYVSSGADTLSDENVPYVGVDAEAVPPCSPHLWAPATTFAITAANMFRNCCGGAGQSTESSIGYLAEKTTPAQVRHQISSAATYPLHTQAGTLSSSGAILQARTLHQIFNALLKKMKSKQQSELLSAVKSRVDPPTKCNPPENDGAIITTMPSYLQCILIKCSPPYEQHMVTCQLFFWSDLRCAAELRRLPTCPNKLDRVYICCNPLHWYRIISPIDSEFVPPPYQRSKMLRLRDTDAEGNSQYNEWSSAVTWTVQGNSNSSPQNQSISSIKKQAKSQLYVQTLESFTTDGKDRNASAKVWCQIAYWELAQRVGELFHAIKSVVNIHAYGPIDGGGESMCLRQLCGKQVPPDAVQNTRHKIGLGVTLSLECGDVWIYNRSNVPIFVDSPTLAERLDRVCKVLPGYCLKAFETNRAQWLAGKQTQHTQLGPIDRFSMKISFAKGWGNTYRRQDVMGCPCWLEVHFNHLR